MDAESVHKPVTDQQSGVYSNDLSSSGLIGALDLGNK